MEFGLPDDMPEELKRTLAQHLAQAHAHQIIEQCMAQMDGAAYALGSVGGFFSVTDLDDKGYKEAMMDVIKAAAGMSIDEWPDGVLRPGGKRNILKFMERKHDYFFKRFRARREKKPLPEMPCFHCGAPQQHNDPESECPSICGPRHDLVSDDDDVASAEELNLRFGYL